MKANIHPVSHKIKIVQTDGTEVEIYSTMGKEGDVVRLDVDHLNHPAWNEGVTTVIERGQLSRFENKFSKFGSFGAKASDADKAS